MNIITEYQYFPSVIFYKGLYNKSNIVFDIYERYQKMSFRNRCIITGANGPVTLSVPLETGRDQKTIMKEVRISHQDNWQKQHWKSIVSSYNRSPWFEFYRDELELIYKKSFVFLTDWNQACFEWSIQKLGWPISISTTNEFIETYDATKWLDKRNTLLPKNYMNFEAVKYRQVFEERTGFMPNLSIIDLLFCEGKRSGDLLSQTMND